MKEENAPYLVDGISLLEIGKTHGFPLYVYSSEIIAKQYHKLQNAFKGVAKTSINYACKALSNLSVLKLMKNLGTGLDTVSIQEILLGLEAGFEPKDIIYTPNGVSLDEIQEAMKKGVRINVDNLSVLEQFGHRFKDYPVGIRINPHIMAGGHRKISVGHINSKFGISIYQWEHIKRIVENTGLSIEGIHMHTGSDILDTDVFMSAANILFDVAKNFKNLNYIDFGSGFKVPYKQGDLETDLNTLSQALTKAFNAFCEAYGKSLELIFEPGKFLVSKAGFFLTKVNVIKQTPSMVFIGVDSGFNHLIRPMFYDAYHEITNLSNPNGNPRFYTVVGYICEVDTFAFNRKINEVHEGHVLCFQNAGAYCFSMASNYNSRYRPAEVMIHNGKAHLIRKAETFDDLVRNQTPMDFS